MRCSGCEHVKNAARGGVRVMPAVFSCMCRKEKTFVAGGAAGKLLLNKKGWLGHDEIVLHKGEGPVSAIAWR